MNHTLLKCLFLFISIFTFTGLSSQCDPPDGQQPPSFECSTAPVICSIEFLDGYCLDMFETNSPGTQPSPLCPGGGAVHNVSWFAWVAGSNTIEMQFTAEDCTDVGGFSGMQVGVYDDCDFSNALFCQPNCFTGTQTFNSSAFVPGQTYYIFIDGCGGSICNVEVAILQGNVPYVIADPLMVTFTPASLPPGFPYDICQGGSLDMQAFGGDPSLDYIWTINPASSDYPDGIVNLTTYDGPVTFSDGGNFEICAQAITSCDSSAIVCTTISVGPLPGEVFMPFEVCEEDFPTAGPASEDPNGDGFAGWQGGQLSGPGTFFGSYVNGAGCSVSQELEVIQIDLPPREIVEVATCEAVFDYCDGNSFATDQFGTWITCDNAAVSGCDSLVELYVTFIDAQGLLSFECSQATDGLEFTFTGFVQPVIGNITWELVWNGNAVVASGSGNPANIPIGVDPPLAGSYDLEITVEIIGLDGFTVLNTCMYSFSTQVDQDDIFPPDPMAGNWPNTVCEGNTVTYTLPAGTDPSYIYNWYITSGATIVQNNNTSITVDWTGASSGSVCVSAYNFCAFSNDFCFPVTVTPTPQATFNSNDTICVTDSGIFTYNGTPLGNGDYTWNFGSGTIVNGTNGDGPGPHEVEWATAGTKFVTLYVSENGCLSPAFTDSIVVQAPISPPLINCSPSIDQVIFTWNAVPGATNYIVNVLSGQTGTLNGTEFTVTGLNPGDLVEIELIIESNNVCPIPPITVDCEAEDCPAPMIEITPVAEICLDANAGTEDLEALVTPNNGGTENWSGPGIVDPDAGIFNPDSAGPGTHQIIFTYSEDCDFNQELIIVVNEQPTANFSATDSICVKDLATITYQGDSPNANFVWDFDNPMNANGSGSGPYTVDWDTPGIKTISCVVTKNNCPSEEFTYNVYVEPALDTVQINCDESTNDITFTWNAIAGVTEYEIFIDNVLVGTQTNTDYYVGGLNPGDNAKITVVALTTGLCPSTSATLTCTAQNCPPVGITLVPAMNNICLDASTGDVLIDAQVNGGTGIDVVETWQGTGVDDQGVFDPAAAGPGTHQIIYTYAEGNCDESDTVNMVVYNTPTADFTVTQAICISDTAQIDFLGSIIGTDTEFTFTLGAGGNITGTNPGPYQVWYNAPGTFNIKLTVEENGCFSEEVIQTITVEPELVPSVINCNSSTSEIEFSWAPVDCASTYEVYIDGSYQGTQTTTTFTETGLQPNDAVNIQVVAISDCLCDDVSFNKVCFALDCPDIDVELAPIGPFCLDDITDIVQIQVTQTGGTGTGTEVWTGPGVSQTGEFDGALAGAGAHLVTYTYTEDDCDFVTNMTVNVFNSPQALVDFADGTCFGSNDGYILVEGFGGTGTYEFDLNGQVNTTGEFYDLSPGDYTVIVSDGNNCSYSEVINIDEPADGSINLSGSTLIGEGETTTLTLTTTNIPANLIDSIVWTENGNVVCSGPGTGCLTYDAMPDSDALYCATTYYNGACTTEDCIEVRIQLVKKVFIPNIFSPNNDGVNDRFMIYADQSVVALTYLRVYDRWGNLMYAVDDLVPNDESKGWDGTHNGKAVNPGVYIFKTEFVHDDGELEEVYGDITIVK